MTCCDAGLPTGAGLPAGAAASPLPAALDGLRGLHPPPADPPRLDGLAGAGLGLILAGLVILARRRLDRRRWPLRRAMLAELDAASGRPAADRLLAQARILDRVARAVPRPRDGAAPSGRAEILDRHFGTDFFTAGPGRALAHGLYARPAAGDADAIEAGLRPFLARLRA
ncbi:MAG: DUF4381 family protein [Methylobacterium frigidaeris]